MDDRPVVSVCMITYGHEEFIEQAVNGVLMQECDFNFELILGNDASPDKTDSIVNAILQNHPQAHRINYLRQEKNIGMLPNFLATLKRCSGKYIALCDGDDYWTDPTKLQRQVDFLEASRECSFCFHKASKIVGIDEKKSGVYPEKVTGSAIDASQFFQITTIPTASVVYRNDVAFPELLHSHPDFLLYCTLLSKGLAGFIDRDMSVYRLHDGGISSRYGSKNYMENRIAELFIEKDYPTFKSVVRRQIKKILTDHILFFISDNRRTLRFGEKIHYIKILLGLRHFYEQPVKAQLRLVKILFQ